MKQITVFEANDGTRWDSIAQAEARDNLVADVARIMAPLPSLHLSCDFSNGSGYYSHDPIVLMKVKQQLIDYTRPRLREWMERQESEFGKDLMTVDASWFARLYDSGDALSRAWERLCCIDGQGREWGQPYFVGHPEEAKQVDLRQDSSC